jgi:hypothetical protein
MRFRIILLAMVASISVPGRAGPPDPEGWIPDVEDKPTARELYVACVLALGRADVVQPATTQARRGDGTTEVSPFHPWVCGRLTMEATQLASPLATHDRWCPPDSADISIENLGPIPQTFLDYFERHASEVAERDGRTVFRQALRDRWPCPAPE